MTLQDFFRNRRTDQKPETASLNMSTTELDCFECAEAPCHDTADREPLEAGAKTDRRKSSVVTVRQIREVYLCPEDNDLEEKCQDEDWFVSHPNWRSSISLAKQLSIKFRKARRSTELSLLCPESANGF